MKKIIALLLAAVLLLGLAACAATPSTDTQQPAAADTTTTAPADDAAAPADDAAAPAEDKQLVIGFANIAEQVELQIQVRESIEKAAAEAGVKLITADNNYDGAKAVEIADNMISQGLPTRNRPMRKTPPNLKKKRNRPRTR